MAGSPVPGDVLHLHSGVTSSVVASHIEPPYACTPQTGHVQTVSAQTTAHAANQLVTPVNFSRVSSAFGGRRHPVRGVKHWHTGIDLTAPSGTPVRAVAQGVVKAIAFERRGYGRYITISHAYGSDTIYAHLSATTPGLRVGSPVSAGDVIGAVGMTGTATGPHLHFELRHKGVPMDPTPLLVKTVSTALAQAKTVSDCQPAPEPLFPGHTDQVHQAHQVHQSPYNAVAADQWKYSPL